MNFAEITHPDPLVMRASRRYAARVANNPMVRRGDGNVAEQVQRYMKSSERFQVLSRRVREVLDDLRIPRFMSLPYRNFALCTLKVMDRFELRTRHIMILEAVDRAAAYGCRRDVLERICRDALGYDIEETVRELHCEE